MPPPPLNPLVQSGGRAGKGPLDTDSAVSEKVARMGPQECKAYATQLRSLLDSAVAEPPPAGVSTAEVERRVRLIQIALDEVERRAEDLHRAAALQERQRYMDTQARRMTAETEAEKARVYQDKNRRERVEELRGAQVAYFKDRNERTDDKATKCRAFGERSQAETMQRATMNDSRRAENLEHLTEARQRHCRELRERDHERQQNIRAANRRKALKQEAERARRDEEARIHDQQREAKLAAIKESRRSTWKAKKNASRAKSLVVFRNGQAILETEAKDHEQLVEDLEAKEKSQQARYATERAEQTFYLGQRAQSRSQRQEKQQENLVRILDKRLERGEGIVEDAKEKRRRGEETKSRQASAYAEHGASVRQAILSHQRRANEVERQREENALSKNYRRWNIRAARIIAELNEDLAADQAQYQAAATADQSGSARYARGQTRDADRGSNTASTPVAAALPMASDFSV